MNVTNKTTRTFDILDLTEQQAQDLLNFCVTAPEHLPMDILDDTTQETLNKLRQALLEAGITRGEQNAS